MANKPGASLSFGDVFGLADAVSAALGDGLAGVVVIQGTDTIEETAYLLDLLVASDGPCRRDRGDAQPVAGWTGRPGEHPDGDPGCGERLRPGNWAAWSS